MQDSTGWDSKWAPGAGGQVAGGDVSAEDQARQDQVAVLRAKLAALQGKSKDSIERTVSRGASVEVPASSGPSVARGLACCATVSALFSRMCCQVPHTCS